MKKYNLYSGFAINLAHSDYIDKSVCGILWSATPQGHLYWLNRYTGVSFLTQGDRIYLRAVKETHGIKNLYVSDSALRLMGLDQRDSGC
jgi:hypothetical protein